MPRRNHTPFTQKVLWGERYQNHTLPYPAEKGCKFGRYQRNRAGPNTKVSFWFCDMSRIVTKWSWACAFLLHSIAIVDKQWHPGFQPSPSVFLFKFLIACATIFLIWGWLKTNMICVNIHLKTYDSHCFLGMNLHKSKLLCSLWWAEWLSLSSDHKIITAGMVMTWRRFWKCVSVCAKEPTFFMFFYV